MILHPKLRLLPALAAAFLVALPATVFAKEKKITVYRDNDGDGHYNKKTIKIDSHRGHPHVYGRSSGYYPRAYVAPVYHGYSSPYYCPPSTSIGVSLYSRPTYTTYSRPSYSYSERVYRGVPASPSYSSYSDELAVDVQRELRRRGYYRGAIDGDVGPGTRAAIRAYQDDRGMSVTGRIDRNLLRSLGVG
jgi:His-Xaa-Ser repeat protein HxsA